MTISERVLAYLKEQPGTPDEIGEALGLTVRRQIAGRKVYRWGNWSFFDEECEGSIELKDGKWHLLEAEG